MVGGSQTWVRSHASIRVSTTKINSPIDCMFCMDDWGEKSGFDGLRIDELGQGNFTRGCMGTFLITIQFFRLLDTELHINQFAT